MRITTILKEGIIFVLLTIVVVFLLMILLSDFVPTEEKAQSVQYTAESNVKATLEEVDAIVSDEDEDIESLLKSYTVDESDLKIYETAKSYESGKTNPFLDFPAAEYENTVTTPGTSGSTTNSVGGSSGTTQGTFFGGSTK